MTGVAFHLAVRAMQRKFRLLVIETRIFPLVLVVARLAFRAIAAIMDVLKPVAGTAIARQILIDLSDMTGRAGDLLMGAHESEFCLPVIKGLGAAPFCRRVTAFALLAKLAVMRIDLLVTVETDRGRFVEWRFPDVTARARRRFMRVDERIIAQVVIEGLLVELHDVGATTLMIAMAVPAFLRRRVLLTTMEPCARVSIGPDRLVAVETEAGLRLARKSLVAFVALGLVFRVALDKRPGNNELLV